MLAGDQETVGDDVNLPVFGLGEDAALRKMLERELIRYISPPWRPGSTIRITEG